MWNFFISFLFDSLDMYRAIMCGTKLSWVHSVLWETDMQRETRKQSSPWKCTIHITKCNLPNILWSTGWHQIIYVKLQDRFFWFDTLDNYRGNYMGGQNSLSVLSVFMEERQKEREGAGILPICVCNIRCFPWSCNGASSTVWMQNSLSEGEAILPSLAWTITRPGHDVILIRVSQQICSLQTLVRR